MIVRILFSFVLLLCPVIHLEAEVAAPSPAASTTVAGANGSQAIPTAIPKADENSSYLAFAKEVNDTAKIAILSAQNNLDVAKWIVIVFAALVTAAAAAGYKSVHEQAKHMDEMFKQRLDLMVEKYDTEVKKTIEDAKEKMNEATKKINNATLVAFFINAARSRSNQIDQLKRKLKAGSATPNEQLEFAALLKFTKKSLQSALTYIDDADDDMIGIMSLAYTGKFRPGIPSKSLLKANVYTTLGWLAKRQDNFTEAIDYAKKVEEIDCEHERATLNIACYYTLLTMRRDLNFLRRLSRKIHPGEIWPERILT